MLRLKTNNIFQAILIGIFVIFPFGQLFKIGINSEIRISLFDLLIALFAIVNFTKFKGFTKKEPLIASWAFLFIIIAFVSILVNDSSTFYLIRLSLYFLFYRGLYKFIYIDKLKKIKLIDKGLLWSGFMVGLFGLIQYLLYPDLRNLIYLGWDPHYYRLFSTFFDPNFSGMILVLTIFQFIFLLQQYQNRFIFYLCFLITVMALFLTRSRSAFLSLIAGIIILLALGKISKKLILFISCIFAFFILLPKPAVDVFDLFRVVTSKARIENWNKSIEIFIQKPVLGFGFGQLRFSDSSFLYVLINTGLVGILSYLFIWKEIIMFGIRQNKNILVIATVLFIGSWFNNILFYPWILFWFLTFLVKNEVYG